MFLYDNNYYNKESDCLVRFFQAERLDMIRFCCIVRFLFFYCGLFLEMCLPVIYATLAKCLKAKGHCWIEMSALQFCHL